MMKNGANPIIPLLPFRGMKLTLTRGGLTSNCQQRRCGRKQPVGRMVRNIPGVKSSIRTFAIQLNRNYPAQAQWGYLREEKVLMNVLIWQEISGNGVLTGLVKNIMQKVLKKIPKDLERAPSGIGDEDSNDAGPYGPSQETSERTNHAVPEADV